MRSILLQIKQHFHLIVHDDNQEQAQMLATYWEVLPTEKFPGTKPAPSIKERKPKTTKATGPHNYPSQQPIPANYTCGKNFNTVAYEIKKQQLNACDKVD